MVVRRLVPLVVVAALAGCGGAGTHAPLDQIAYEVRLAPLDDVLDRTFDGDARVVARDLRALAGDLDGVTPPPAAAAAHAQLVQVLRYLAEDVEEGDTLAYADDWERLQDVVYDFRDRGFEPFDGPDDA